MKKILIRNKKIRYDYFIEKEVEAGLVLEGWEVKSLIKGKGDLVDSFVKDINGELFLVGCNVQTVAETSSHTKPDMSRFKKLLLNKKEINNLIGLKTIDGYTLMCEEIYIDLELSNKLKAKICLCKGKKNYDKRHSIKEKDEKRKVDRFIKNLK